MNPRLLLFLTLILIPLSGLGVDLYTPSLPAISTHFHVSPALTKLTISMYLVGFSLGQFIFGTFSDIYGRRPVLLIGLMFFIVGSFIATFIDNIYILFTIRILQGLGAAAASVICKALLTDTLKDHKLDIAMNYLTIVWGLGPIVAPLIGGYLQFYYSWHANFYFYTLYSSFLFLSVFFLLKETIKTKMKFYFPDILRNYITLVSHPLFFGCTIMLGIGYSLILVFSILGPFLIQDTMGYNAAVYGHIALIIGSAYFIGTVIARFYGHRVHPRNLIYTGLVIMAIANGVMFFFAYAMPLSLVRFIIPVYVTLVSVGMFFPIVLSKALGLFSHIGGSASAAVGGIFTGISFFITAAISPVKAHSLVPFAWTFFAFVIIHFLVYYTLIRKNI